MTGFTTCTPCAKAVSTAGAVCRCPTRRAQPPRVRTTLLASLRVTLGNRPMVLNQKTRFCLDRRRNRWMAEVGKPFQSSDNTTKSRPVIITPPFGCEQGCKQNQRSAGRPCRRHKDWRRQPYGGTPADFPKE